MKPTPKLPQALPPFPSSIIPITSKQYDIGHEQKQVFGLGIQVMKIGSKKEMRREGRSINKGKREGEGRENGKGRDNGMVIGQKLKQLTGEEYEEQRNVKCQNQFKPQSLYINKNSEKYQKSMPKVPPSSKYDPIIQNPIPKVPTKKPKQVNSANAKRLLMQQISNEQISFIAKQYWQQQLNILPRFYTEYDEYKVKEEVVGRGDRKVGYLGNAGNFVEGYLTKYVGFDGNYEEEFDPYGIEYFYVGESRCLFDEKNYESYRLG